MPQSEHLKERSVISHRPDTHRLQFISLYHVFHEIGTKSTDSYIKVNKYRITFILLRKNKADLDKNQIVNVSILENL